MGRIVFPVPGGTFTNDWGAARADTGTHKGNDIFAPRGTPVYAVEDGTISKIGYQKIGGNRLWINGKWYYAHLDRYAPGISKGAHVRAGQIIGYVGTTGDAAGTPPHLHFGYDPSGTYGQHWQNPYPILTAAKRGKDVPSGNTRGGKTPDTSGVGAAVFDVGSQNIEQLSTARPSSPGPILGPGEVVGGGGVTEPQSSLSLWQMLAAQPNSSPQTQRYLSLAQLADPSGQNG